MRLSHNSAVRLLLLCVISPLAMAQVYHVTDLRDLTPTGVNALGHVVGNTGGHAFLWTRAAGARDLGILPGGTFSTASAINDYGVITGVADGAGIVVSHNPDLQNKSCSSLTQPFIWTRNRGMQGLGATGMFGEDQFYDDWCFFDYYATDINFHGEIVGTNRDFATYKWGFLWAGANGIILFPDAFQTAVNGINNVAQVVGQTGDVELFQESHAALWSAQGKMDLGTLGGDSSDWSYCSGANSINDLSGVVGWSTTVSEPLFACPDLLGVHAFYWKAGAGMQDLGTLPGDTASVARKINFFGQVIGDSGNTVVWHDGDPSGWIEVTGRPFIWTQHGGMQDLNALIPANSGWVLNSVSGINVWGQIVGSGTRNGQPHGFVLTPTLSSTRRHGERERE